MKVEFLFVYGTLRRDTGSRMHRLLARHADFAGEATYQGRLYRIDYYPGVVPSGDPSDIVHGEVYRLHDPGLMLSQLDEYEGCGPDAPQPAQYVRRLQEVRLNSGRLVRAWVYVYTRPIDDAKHLASGDFATEITGHTGRTS